MRSLPSRKAVTSALKPLNVILIEPLSLAPAIVVEAIVPLPSGANIKPLSTLSVTVILSSLPSAMTRSDRSKAVLISSSIANGPTLFVASVTVGSLLVSIVCVAPML